ncbi:MAG TPA: M48 family metalloprotease [Candidatus Eisenbacteria bacterium]|nr:M48 family metalloprotease [Candidatus Eisenbacteria bacterium]
MRNLKCLAFALAFGAIPLAAAPGVSNPKEVVDQIMAQERLEMQSFRRYSPLVETYIQYVRPDKQFGDVPDGDKYFLGRADLANGLEIESLDRGAGIKQRFIGGLGKFFSTEFVPGGFLQMIYLDRDNFDRAHYNLEYVGREFLGEVRCFVFDVSPLPNAGKGRFVGRVWVEDENFHIVRFNGRYGGASLTNNYLNFDSWRVNVGKNIWVPAFVYSEGPRMHDPKTRSLGFKAFRAQTRLWGYDLGHVGEQQELSKVLVEGPTQLPDLSQPGDDYSPFQALRTWDRMAEMNVTDQLQRQGLLAPPGDVDKVLNTVVNNLEVTNNLDIQPEVRCRVLMTSTLEAFTVGHTIVLSRGLIDVLPDEASLAVVLAHELGHVVLRHRMDNQFAFFGQLRFNEKETFHHFDFSRSEEEELAADKKAVELLKNSPYNSKLPAAEDFLQELMSHSKEIPNLVSPHLGDSVANRTIGSAMLNDLPPDAKAAANDFSALPLGGRIKVNPWNDRLTLLKVQSIGALAEDEKRPLQVTPIALYLTRHEESAAPGSATAILAPGTQP